MVDARFTFVGEGTVGEVSAVVMSVPHAPGPRTLSSTWATMTLFLQGCSPTAVCYSGRVDIIPARLSAVMGSGTTRVSEAGGG